MMSIPRAPGRPWTEPSTRIGRNPGRPSAPRGRAGFTLIELIIVFTLIAILVGLGLPQFKNASKNAREVVLKEDLFQFRKLIDQFYVDKHKYPPTLEALVEEGYLREIPVDPITKSNTTWVVEREPITEENLTPGFEPGIIDVHSGSEGTALDGTKYNAW
jgi:general secretion pathway protein G